MSCSFRQIPVFAGADGPLVFRPHREIKYHLEDGFNDIKFNEVPDVEGRLQKETAVTAINRLINENEGKTLIAGDLKFKKGLEIRGFQIS